MANRFWRGGTGTWDSSTTTHWSTTSGGAGGVSVPGSSDAVIFDENSGGGTVTPNYNMTVASIAMGNFTGTLDFSTNNNSPTMGYLDGQGTGLGSVKTLKMGSGTWELTGTGGSVPGSVWRLQGSDFTLTANTSTIKITDSSTTTKYFIGSNKTYYNLWKVNTGAELSSGDLRVGNTNTFNNIKLDAGTRMQGESTATQTVSSFTAIGTAGNKIFLTNDQGIFGDNWILSKASGTVTTEYLDISQSDASGGATFKAINSIDSGNNSGWAFTPAPLVATMRAFTLTGIVATLTASGSYLITATHAVFSLTGSNSILTFLIKNYILTAVQASYVLTGIAATLQAVGNYFLTAETAIFSVTGYVTRGLLNGMANWWSNTVKNLVTFSVTLKSVSPFMVEYLATQDIDYLITEDGDYLITGLGITYDPTVSPFNNAVKNNSTWANLAKT